MELVSSTQKIDIFTANRIHVAQDRVQRLALVSTAMNLWVQKMEGIS
jgi:hypothetical protein